MKIERLAEYWVVVETVENDLPILVPFYTREEARRYVRSNKPTLLSKFKLYYERLAR